MIEPKDEDDPKEFFDPRNQWTEVSMFQICKANNGYIIETFSSGEEEPTRRFIAHNAKQLKLLIDELIA